MRIKKPDTTVKAAQVTFTTPVVESPPQQQQQPHSQKRRNRKRLRSAWELEDKRLQEKENKYEVEELLDKRYDASKQETQYLVKWKNYSHQDNTWEPEALLFEDVPDLVVDFNDRLEEDLTIVSNKRQEKSIQKEPKPDQKPKIAIKEKPNIQVKTVNEKVETGVKTRSRSAMPKKTDINDAKKTVEQKPQSPSAQQTQKQTVVKPSQQRASSVQSSSFSKPPIPSKSEIDCKIQKSQFRTEGYTSPVQEPIQVKGKLGGKIGDKPSQPIVIEDIRMKLRPHPKPKGLDLQDQLPLMTHGAGKIDRKLVQPTRMPSQKQPISRTQTQIKSKKKTKAKRKKIIISIDKSRLLPDLQPQKTIVKKETLTQTRLDNFRKKANHQQQAQKQIEDMEVISVKSNSEEAENNQVEKDQIVCYTSNINQKIIDNQDLLNNNNKNDQVQQNIACSNPPQISNYQNHQQNYLPLRQEQLSYFGMPFTPQEAFNIPQSLTPIMKPFNYQVYDYKDSIAYKPNNFKHPYQQNNTLPYDFTSYDQQFLPNQNNFPDYLNTNMNITEFSTAPNFSDASFLALGCVPFIPKENDEALMEAAQEMENSMGLNNFTFNLQATVKPIQSPMISLNQEMLSSSSQAQSQNKDSNSSKALYQPLKVLTSKKIKAKDGRLTEKLQIEWVEKKDNAEIFFIKEVKATYLKANYPMFYIGWLEKERERVMSGCSAQKY